MTRLFRIAAAALLLGLAGCGGGAPAPAPNTPQGQCAAAAAQDPDVRAVQEQVLVARASNLNVQGDPAAVLRRQKTQECLRARGLAPLGGVQRVQ